MVEEDKKVNSEIWKEHQDKEAKGLKKIYMDGLKIKLQVK